MTAVQTPYKGGEQVGAWRIPKPSVLALDLAGYMLEVASTQGPNTPLDGYPGGSPEAEQIQLGIMRDDCEQGGIHADLIAEASQLVVAHWNAARGSNGN